jgi:hypothetical protein
MRMPNPNITDLISQVRELSTQLEPLLKADVEPQSAEQPASPDVSEPAEGTEQPASPDMSKPEGEEPQGEGEGQGDEETYEQMFANLEPEALNEIIEAAQKVLAGKQGAPAAAPGAEPEAAPAASPLEEKMEKMAKSMESLLEHNQRLEKSLAELKARPASKPASRPAPMNSTEVPTLRKSADEPPEMLAKSDVVNYLLSEQRNGNRKITPAMVSYANDAESPEALRRVYAAAEGAGIKIPHKK